MVQRSTRNILKSLNTQSFLLLGISILVKGMDVPLSPVTPNVILIRKDMCKARIVPRLDIFSFRNKICVFNYFEQAFLKKKKSQSKKAHSADMSELRNFCFDSFGTSEILYTEHF